MHNPGIEWERGHAADEGVDATTHQLRQMHLEQPLKRGRAGWAKKRGGQDPSAEERTCSSVKGSLQTQG